MRLTDCSLAHQEEVLQRNGHQKWHRLVLLDFNDGQQFKGLIHEYETWSESSELSEPIFRGVRGEGVLKQAVCVLHDEKRGKYAFSRLAVGSRAFHTPTCDVGQGELIL